MVKHIILISWIISSSLLLIQQAYGVVDLEWNHTQVKIELQPGEAEAQAEFVVTNKGEETVRITNIKTSCGCTGSILDKKTIYPGESSTIIGTFKKGSRQGLNHNRLQVFLDNQPKPAATLHMIVQIPRLIEIQPSIVYWNRSSPKTKRNVHINLDERYLDKITSITYDSLSLTVTEKADPKAKADRMLEIMPASFEKQLRKTIHIQAQGPDGVTAQAKLQVFVQP